MWLWTVFLCLLIFYGYTSSQPVTDESENARHARQLDFGECCPCPGAGQGFGLHESSMPSGDSSFSRARDLDDCPCRGRSPDSEGASSMFFPTSIRSDGNILRPLDKKEDFKPLLHPEVDLASSVLQTLREATDEEYQDALARDAARSMAKAAEGTIFEDAVPEASSGNIVTIIVNPKHADSLDDVIPQESQIQESRCVHAPLESKTTNLGQMRLASKSPSLLRDFFGTSKPAGLLHRSLLDMDSGLGASNVKERVVDVDDDQVINKSIQGLRKYAPLMKLGTNIKGKSTNMKSSYRDDDSTVKKVPDFKLPSMKNKLKDLMSNRSAVEGKGKLNSFPLIPQMSLNNSLSKAKGKNNEDLRLSPNNIKEQAKTSFFQTKSHLENILQKTKPVGFKTLLKLKDVELVPLKDLVHKAVEKPTFKRSKFGLPAVSIKRDTNPINLGKTTKIIEKMPKTSEHEIIDHDVSPSNVIEQISEDKCHHGAFKTTKIDDGDTEDEITSTEMIDVKSSPSDIQSTVSDTSKDFANSQWDELADNTDNFKIETLPVTETNFPRSMESSFDSETQDGNEDELVLETSKEVTSHNIKEEEDSEPKYVSDDEDCVHNIRDADSFTDSSNNIYDVLKPTDVVLENIDDSLVNKNTVTEESCNQELSASDNSKSLDSNSQTELIKPLSLDENLSGKENVIKQLKNLGDPNESSQNANILDRTPSKIIENTESSPIPAETLDFDSQNEESIQVTTVKSDICNDDVDDNVERSDNVNMQDLQKISDLMLQKEEQERETKTLDCSAPLQDVTDLNIPIKENSRVIENIDSEQSANSQNEVIIDPQQLNIADNNDNDIKNTCHSNILPNNSLMQEIDPNAEGSEVVINRTPQSSDIISSPLLLNKVKQPNEINFSLINIPIPGTHDIKLAPIPTLDEMKLGLTNLFDKTVRDVEESMPSVADAMTDTSNVLKPIMSTDASTSIFQSRLPLLRLEDVNLDILQLKPQLNLFSKIPKLDLHSYKTKLPLPIDFLIKPTKLQSALNDKGSVVGATLTVGRSNPWESTPNLDNFGTKVKTNTQKISKTLHKPKAFRNSLISSQGIGDLSDTKSTLKSMQHTLESRFKGAIKKPLNLQTNDLLEVISRNHEDVNDKLRALHVDFNDRIETMRNNLFDKSRFGSGESRSAKSVNAFSNQNKDKKMLLKTPQPQSLTSRRESKKTLKPRRLEQQRENEIRSSQRLPTERKFKMPAAFSVPVPRTIEIPELKAALAPDLTTQRSLGINPNIQNTEASQAKQSSVALWKQATKELPITNKRLGKSMNPFKDSKIKVSFSTTPRPTLQTRLQSRKLSTPSSNSLSTNLGKITGRFRQGQDHNGSPSEMKHSIISPPATSSHLDPQNLENHGLDNESKQLSTSYDGSSRKLSSRINLEANSQPTMSKDLKSWPKVSESAFLSKVKEAVNARLSKVNSPITFKKADGKSVSSSVTENGEDFKANTDMTRSASENIDIIEGEGLKENVSYKCTMVCTKE